MGVETSPRKKSSEVLPLSFVVDSELNGFEGLLPEKEQTKLFKLEPRRKGHLASSKVSVSVCL